MKRMFSAAALLCAIAILPSAAFATSTVKVTLGDSGEVLDLSKNLGMAPGTKMDMTKAPMYIKIQPVMVPAGTVVFKVTNKSKSVIHEMLLAPTADANTPLPYIETENRADEEKTHDLGEVSELDPGKSGELTVDMKPGTYMIFCNVPGHLGAGMWTTIKVK